MLWAEQTKLAFAPYGSLAQDPRLMRASPGAVAVPPKPLPGPQWVP